MQGARFILNSRFFHIAKPGEELSDYALSKSHIERLVEYCATRETVDYNLIINSSDDLPATKMQKETVKELLNVLENNNSSLKLYELDEYKSESTRKNALKLISRIREEILSDESFNENALQAAQNAKKTMDFYDRNKQHATEKQIDTINQFLKEINYKENEDMPLEYYDYKSAPTVQNASELISRLSEELLMRGGFDEISNLVEYAAKRPGVVKVGEHGLFSSNENVDLEAAKEEISTHDGNIWTHILSLRREDANALGYDSQRPWRNLIMSHIDDIAKTHVIKPENLRWYAAMHNTTHHPHIHLFVYSIDPKEGFFYQKANKSITTLKSKFVTDIFRDERHEIYIDKDIYHKELDYKAEKALNDLIQNPNKYITDKILNDIANKMLLLSQKYRGSAKYGFQTKEVKALVNEIQLSLVNNNEQLSDLYKKWCAEEYNLHKYYVKDKLPNIPPIDKVDKFNTVKNIILRQAKELKENTINSNRLIDVSNNPTAEHTVDKASYISTYIPVDDYTIDDLLDTSEYIPTAKNKMIQNNVSISHSQNENTYNKSYSTSKYNPIEKYIKQYPEQIFYSPEPENPELSQIFGSSLIFESDNEGVKNFKSLSILANDLSVRNGEICRNLADCYNYGIGTEKNETSAVMWYGIAADEFQDSMASYRIGQFYLYGTDGIDMDKDLGHFYCNKAFYLFLNEIKNSMFFDDLDRGSNELHYQVDVSKTDSYKEYLMGRMYLKGEGVEQDYFKSYQTFLLAAENGYAHSNYYIGNQYYYGLGFNQDYEEALSYYRKASEAKDSYADYRIAKMYLKGEGVNADLQRAEEYLLKAADKVTLANYDLAKLYEDNSETFNKSEDKIFSLYHNAIEKMLEQEQEGHDVFTEMRIASMYLNGKGTEMNISEAANWLEKAAKQGNPDAAYQLAYIYSSQKYNIIDIKKSNKYYAEASLEYEKAEEYNENATAEYRIGLIYLNALGVEQDIGKALHWLEKSTLNGNSSASYKLAVLYDEGTEVTQNTDKALLYYRISAELGNPYAHYKLGNVSIEKENISQAIEHFEKAADKNISHAWYKLGQIYSNEKYGVLDTEKTNVCYERALQQYILDYQENPDNFTSYRIGNMHLHAQGTEQNISESIAWFEKSAQQGNSDAAYQLGYIFKIDDYGVRNDELSNKYFSSALSSYQEEFSKNPTDSNLAMRIGTFYHYGLGVEHDIEKAISWYKKAVELGNQKAQQKIDEAEQTHQLSVMSVATTACHFGRILNTETIAAAKNRYISDTKILHREKVQKIYAGQSINDNAQSYDY